MTTFFSIGTFFAIFIGILLFTKKGKTLPDKVLGIWMFITGLHLLAYEAGFNSKSSFNNLFKKMTSQTPSQYIKSTKF